MFITIRQTIGWKLDMRFPAKNATQDGRNSDAAAGDHETVGARVGNGDARERKS